MSPGCTYRLPVAVRAQEVVAVHKESLLSPLEFALLHVAGLHVLIGLSRFHMLPALLPCEHKQSLPSTIGAVRIGICVGVSRFQLLVPL